MAVAAPELLGAWEGLQAELALALLAQAGAVVEEEGVAVAGEDERRVQGVGVGQRLLQAIAHGMAVVLGFDHRQRYLAHQQHIVGPPWFAAGHQPSAHRDPPSREAVLAQNLLPQPPRLMQSWCNEPVADVGLAQALVGHQATERWLRAF